MRPEAARYPHTRYRCRLLSQDIRNKTCSIYRVPVVLNYAKFCDQLMWLALWEVSGTIKRCQFRVSIHSVTLAIAVPLLVSPGPSNVFVYCTHKHRDYCYHGNKSPFRGCVRWLVRKSKVPVSSRSWLWHLPSSTEEWGDCHGISPPSDSIHMSCWWYTWMNKSDSYLLQLN